MCVYTLVPAMRPMARERCWALSDCLISADRAGSKGGGEGGEGRGRVEEEEA